MKVKYTCEMCNKEYDTPEEAKECEGAHERLKKRDELKAKSEEVIEEMINKHIETFGEYPKFRLSEDNQSFLDDEIEDNLFDILNDITELVDLLREDETTMKWRDEQ